MNCVGCGFVIQTEFAFCPKCGARQPSRCASCGYVCPPDFAFCPKCGLKQGATPQPIEAPLDSPPSSQGPARLAPAPATPVLAGEADRRTVTVLFADLSGFTTLSEQLDPEVMQVLQNELFEELTTAVEEFGGFVDKFIGDALLALFGAPHAHEDDPERALRAALAMIERTARLDVRWRGRAGMPLTLHLGVNTGPVVAGGFGAGSAKSYSVTGDAVNTAQRLQSLAGVGEVLVGPTTYRLVASAPASNVGRWVSTIISRLRSSRSASRRSTSSEAASAQCRSSTTRRMGARASRRSKSVRTAKWIWRLSCSGSIWLCPTSTALSPKTSSSGGMSSAPSDGDSPSSAMPAAKRSSSTAACSRPPASTSPSPGRIRFPAASTSQP